MLSLIAAVLSAVVTLTMSGAPSFEKVVERTLPSIAPLYGEEHSCTSFSVGKNEFATAAHCVNRGKFSIAGYEISNFKADPSMDIAVVHVPGLSLPPVKFANKVTLGEQLASFGYGIGSMKVGDNRVSELMNGQIIIWNGAISGMSGGPVMNMRGELVSIVSRAKITPPYSALIGVGPDIGVIKKFLAENPPGTEPSPLH